MPCEMELNKLARCLLWALTLSDSYPSGKRGTLEQTVFLLCLSMSCVFQACGTSLEQTWNGIGLPRLRGHGLEHSPFTFAFHLALFLGTGFYRTGIGNWFRGENENERGHRAKKSPDRANRVGAWCDVV